MLKHCVAFVVGATLSLGAHAAPISDYTGFVAFGDSLSDGGDSLSDLGNLYELTLAIPQIGRIIPQIPGSPPVQYHKGRFSNGPVWTDHVAAHFAGLGRPTLNMAWGLAGALPDDTPGLAELIPDLQKQIDLATPGLGGLGDRPLASVWSGANDVFDFVESRGATPSPEAVAAAVLSGIASLITAGVEDIVAFTLPDFGLIPRFAKFQPDLVDAASEATVRFNAFLLQGIARFAPGVGIDVVRMDRLIHTLFDDPGRYGISELSAPCIDPAQVGPATWIFTPVDPSPPPKSVCADPSGYAFFDANHPSATLHAAIAGEFVAAIAPIPLPATLPLAGTGFALILAFRRRRA